MDTYTVIFFLALIGIALATGWMFGVRQGSGESYYNGYTDGYNTALDDMERLVDEKQAKKPAKKATKKTTTKKKGK